MRGGEEGRRKINWVSWDVICKQKKEGELGVKDLYLFNLSLLGKWVWRLRSKDDPLWKRILRAKYGNNAIISLVAIPGKCSRLWFDLCKLFN